MKFIAGYKGRRYFSDDDWYWEYQADLWEITCKACIKRLIKENRQAIKEAEDDTEVSVAVLTWGSDFTPETWLEYGL